MGLLELKTRVAYFIQTKHPNTALDARQLADTDLARALRHARARTWACVEDLTDAQWLPTCQAGINPIAWELAHLAWFAEYWTLRSPHSVDTSGFSSSPVAPRFAGPDAHFDSSRLPHAARWTTLLPSRHELKDIHAAQLDASLIALAAMTASPSPTCATVQSLDADLYFHRLALFHEDMHCEALYWLRSTLGYSAPDGIALAPLVDSNELRVTGGEVQIGQPAGALGFAFDNERDAITVNLAPFQIDATPVSALAFSRFVEAGGYDNPCFWPGAAADWRAQSNISHPAPWRKNPSGKTGDWQMRWFDQWVPLDGRTPLIHVNAFEAEAYCLWAKRRLPTAAEWEHAALAAPGLHWGHSVWEWTADAFLPYPGFSPGPYRDYSKPWFGNHRELRGGAFATETRMHNPRYRNFFLPHRSDIFSGFRTVAQ